MQYNKKILRASLENAILYIQLRFQVNWLKVVSVNCPADLKISVIKKMLHSRHFDIYHFEKLN